MLESKLIFRGIWQTLRLSRAKYAAASKCKTVLWWRAQAPQFDTAQDQPLRLALFSIDQLESHARDLAAKHQVSLSPRPDSLLSRLADNESVLFSAYEHLSHAVHNRQRISPAGEWLLDNFHVIEEQIRTARRHLPPGYSRELPHLRQEGRVGLPRVYDIALEVIAHVDGHVDKENITRFVAAYQHHTRLCLGELWAIPIMLRLALIENLRRVACRVVVGLQDREKANDWANQLLAVAEKEPRNLILVAADMARAISSVSNSFVAEFVRRLHGQGHSLDIPLAWVEQQLIEAGSTTQEAVQLESQQQAANQVSVGASISSLRFLSAMDWRTFVESLNSIDRELMKDPSHVYHRMDFATRDNYRHAIEKLAKRTGRAESEIARAAVELAEEASDDPRCGHVGYYLIDKGRKHLGTKFQVTKLPAHRLELSGWQRLALYLVSIAALTFFITGAVFFLLRQYHASTFVLAAASALSLIVASQVAVALTNWLATLLIKPRLLPRMDFSKGIPAEYRALVVVPTLLHSPRNAVALLDALEVRYLANRNENLHFALLTDFTDSSTETKPNDQSLLNLVTAGIDALNKKYAGNRMASSGDTFLLLHRSREWNAQEGVWMGRERKRGKLDALNFYLRNPSQCPFSVVVGALPAISPIKFVLTLDTDTQLPRDAASELVATMAHPLNRPVYDAALGRVTEGYGILQPRVGCSLPTSRNSLFVRIFGGEAGIDPYSRAVSDVYQDLFGEGSFIGKGIYDVDAFTTSLAGRFPENLILSHDLIEGCHVRCGLVSDVLLYEDFPSSYLDDANRRSRWIRGDWQILQWLFAHPPSASGEPQTNPISALSRWKIFDNLRRSLVPIATLLILVVDWFWGPAANATWVLTSAVLAMIFLPPLLTSLAAGAHKSPEATWRAHLVHIADACARHLIQAFLIIATLPFEAYLSLRAITLSLVRTYITRKRLLEWRSASSASEALVGARRFYYLMACAPMLAVGLLIAMWSRPQILADATPFLVLWLVSPGIAAWISRQLIKQEAPLSSKQVEYLRRLSRKTWQFFEVFIGAEDNWLPPDNFQEYPSPIIAHRTSPTNIGLSLVANLSAHDFGYLSALDFLHRTTQTFDSLDRLERFRGHFYNWYDTVSLAPLPPLYVSTVDSGNLVGMLLTLRQGLLELPQQRVISPEASRGLLDALKALTEQISLTPAMTELESELSIVPRTLGEARAIHERVQARIDEIAATITATKGNDTAEWWLQALSRQCRSAYVDSQGWYLPLRQFLKAEPRRQDDEKLDELLNSMEAIPTWSEVAQLGSLVEWHVQNSDIVLASPTSTQFWYSRLLEISRDISAKGADFAHACDILAQRCLVFSDVEYDFLFDGERRLFSIGYNVSDHRRDSGYYDLLASEARLGSFVAIAQGHIPQEHWFSLGRLLTAWKRESTLLSWSGSMFEYLMPMLVMPHFKDTLLDQTCRTAVRRQIAYGHEHGIPWGVSESGYNTTDVNLNYQYRAFGVPGLGFKRGLAEDLVLAPYASAMAVMVDPKVATSNLQRMHTEGFEGRYGFYEAIDYTPSRLSTGQTHAVVRSYMAHHQGMSFLALANHLLGNKLQSRFQSDPQFKATELLLHERVPMAGLLYPHANEVGDPLRTVNEQSPSLRVINTPNTVRPEVHLLSNGRLKTMITNSGGGYSQWKDLALTRWREDPTCDNWGSFCFLRDVTSGDVWSSTHQPSLHPAAHYEAIFPQAKAEFRRRDFDIEMHTEIAISPEDDIELRRMTITNLSSEFRVIEFTTYAEVTLAPQAMDLAHPAFSNLFVQTEIVHDRQAILCSRRPRSDSDHTPTMFHLMTVYGDQVGSLSFETDRLRFIGRGGNIGAPSAVRSYDEGIIDQDLSGASGSVLDPIVAIRCRVRLPPEQSARVHIVTGVGEERADALNLAQKYQDRHLADRVFELAWTHRQVVLRQLDVTEVDAQIYGRLASSIIYANPLRRASPSVLLKNRRGQSGLWGYGISGDLPIVLLRIGSVEYSQLARQLIQAHGYWRMMGLIVDLVIWNEDESSYRQNLQDRLMDMIAADSYSHQLDKAGGIFVRRSDQMSEEDRILLQTVARAIIVDTNGTLNDQVTRRGRKIKAAAPFKPNLDVSDESGEVASHSSFQRQSDLMFSNGFGGFSADGREYVINTSSDQITPAPWSNVLANPHFGSVVSESGSAYTWCENAHEYRLTPWLNDALIDQSGEAMYLRDEDTGAFWSPTPLPARADATYQTRHGFGYSVFVTKVQSIETELTTFVAIDAPIKMNLLKVRNDSDRRRRLSVTGYCEWVLGEQRAKSLMHLVSEVDQMTGAMFMRNHFHPEFGGRVGFFNVSEALRSHTGDRSEFIGRNGQLEAPAALFQSMLSGRVGPALDACTAMQTSVELAPGEEREILFVLGVARDVDDARTLLGRFGKPDLARAALDAIEQHWARTLGAVQIATPDPSLDFLVNGWLIYQVLSSRLWGRSGYYQSGGAYGFRDQLQDTMALLHTEPQLLREHLLRCAARQFREGDVQHWWHPPSGFGVRTRFSDDLLWLPLATCRYVHGIGDTGVLDERINFVEGRPVKLDEEAYGGLPAKSDEAASLYEHCVRAIRHASKLGRNGLPLMGCGDWNDGMNLVGEHGRGESVWLAFFLCTVLDEFAPIAEQRGDLDFAKHCRKLIATLTENIEANSWDGEWYRRAYFDNGQPMGSAQNSECQIDSLPQSWAVLSGVGDPDRARSGMEAVYHRLVDQKNGLIKLFDPPFDKSQPNPGYIKGYVPGVRENGGQYTHAAIWSAMAFAKLGDTVRSWELLDMINPINHGCSPETIATYKVEPYVVAADVYAVRPHTGRGGWTWYTGSASWLYRLILESLLGIELKIDRLTLKPCLPTAWRAFEIRYRYRETYYQITVKTSGDPGNQPMVFVDGMLQAEPFIHLVDDRQEHRVTWG